MPDVQDLYRIGTVAKLTGIAVERLRAWERRYGLMPTERAGKTRMYSAAQVERLTQIRKLIDQGHPISTLIELSNQQLSDRLTRPSDMAPAAARRRATAKPCQVGLIGTQLLMLEQANAMPSSVASNVEVKARWVSLDAYLDNHPHNLAQSGESNPVAEVDIFVILIASLSAPSLAELAAIPQKKLIVYHFATSEALADAKTDGLAIAPWPISWPELCQSAGRLAGAPLRADYRYPRRFADEQLLAMAGMGTALGCSCPGELIDLISRLNAFSEHNALCREPGDTEAATHARLQAHSCAARSELENALGDWVDAHQALNSVGAREPLRN